MCPSLGKRVMKCFQRIALEHIKIDKAENSKQKTAPHGQDAGGLLIDYMCIFIHESGFHSFQYHGRAGRDI